MLAVEFTFPAGRYHATPWDRHVNEGAVAWPPEPWRILRALIATWHHKIKHEGKHSETTLAALIESLGAGLPNYRLPAASHSHTRHYMPQYAAGKTSLVLDAFTAVNRDDALTVIWPELDLPDDQRALLDDLLAVIGYLGRAESWVEAACVAQPPEPDCIPGNTALDTITGEIKSELVTLYAPLPKNEYQTLRENFLVDKKARKKLDASLPDGLLGALSVDTAELRKQGWSQPPAARKVNYLRPLDALRPRRNIPAIGAPVAHAVSFILTGKPLPQVEDSLRIGELMRIAAMSRFKQTLHENAIPSIISGHGLPADNRHRHVFYLPWDSNGDGRLDRVLVFAPDGLTHEQQQIIAGARRLWDAKGSEWRLTLESVGDKTIAMPLTGRSATWESVTPWLHPWHVKPRFTLEDQFRRECRERGLPEPITFETFDQVAVGNSRYCRPTQFQRFRQRRSLHQPDRLGSFWRLTFAEPITGPLALGFACHNGLGLFRPVDS